MPNRKITESTALQPFLAGLGLRPSLNNRLVDIIGDSRSQDANSSAANPAGLTAVHFFNWAMTLNGHRLRLVNNYGISGSRSDQYLAGYNSAGELYRGGMAEALKTSSGWLMFGYPAANDIAQAFSGYTNRNGVAVTLLNVAEVCANNIIAAVQSALAVGKKVILCMEPGATNFNTAQIAAMHELNLRLRSFIDKTNNVYLFNANPVVHDASSGVSASAIVFKPNLLRVNDQVHFSVAGGFAVALEFNKFLATLPGIAMTNHRISTFAEGENGSSINPRQLIRNPLFRTLTGGTIVAASGGSGGGTGTIAVTGNVPAGWTLQGPSNISCTVTSAAHPDGMGNKIILEFTSTGAGSCIFQCQAPAQAAWNVNDTFQFSADVEVAAGASNAHVGFLMGLNGTNSSGTAVSNNYFGMFGTTAYSPYPTAAWSGTFVSQPGKLPADAVSKSFILSQLMLRFEAAGSIKVTISRASFERLFD